MRYLTTIFLFSTLCAGQDEKKTTHIGYKRSDLCELLEQVEEAPLLAGLNPLGTKQEVIKINPYITFNLGYKKLFEPYGVTIGLRQQINTYGFGLAINYSTGLNKNHFVSLSPSFLYYAKPNIIIQRYIGFSLDMGVEADFSRKAGDNLEGYCAPKFIFGIESKRTSLPFLRFTEVYAGCILSGNRWEPIPTFGIKSTF